MYQKLITTLSLAALLSATQPTNSYAQKPTDIAPTLFLPQIQRLLPEQNNIAPIQIRKRQTETEWLDLDIAPVQNIRKRETTLEQLARRNYLNPEEFDVLRSEVKTIEDYKKVLALRGIYYPENKTIEYNSALNTHYGSAFQTHNRGYGICDEFAVYFASFFVGKEGYDVYILGMRDAGDRRHASAIYQAPNKKWGFVNNWYVSQPRYEQDTDALTAAINNIRFNPTKTKVVQMKQMTPGPWIYNDAESFRL